MKTTEENLKEAFAGESMANRKYLAFARQAEKDGFKNVASLFRATAEAEAIHANGHLNALDAVKTTKENLEYAIRGETYETQEMYPPMYEQAEKENHKAKKMFKWAMDVERIHAELYQLALDAVASGKDIEEVVWLCPVCGHLEFKTPPTKCPVCGTPGSKYEQYSAQV